MSKIYTFNLHRFIMQDDEWHLELDILERLDFTFREYLIRFCHNEDRLNSEVESLNEKLVDLEDKKLQSLTNGEETIDDGRAEELAGEIKEAEMRRDARRTALKIIESHMLVKKMEYRMIGRGLDAKRGTRITLIIPSKAVIELEYAKNDFYYYAVQLENDEMMEKIHNQFMKDGLKDLNKKAV